MAFTFRIREGVNLSDDIEFSGRLFDDVYNAVIEDGFMFIVIWGPPRSSKTTLGGDVLYSLYKDWDKMLQALIFDLGQAMHRLRNGLPERWPTRNKLHMRVPAILWDDFGARSNKAETQYDQAFDLFKGGFDVIGTKCGSVITTMVDPNEPTFQLLCKYTHEVQVLEKGYYKYDKVLWQQNFSGFRTRVKKIPIETGEFDMWPDEVYEKYDEQRMSLADEVFVRIDDAILETGLQKALKLIKSDDLKLLQAIDDLGPISHDKAKEHVAKDTIVRCKARNFVLSFPKSGGNYYLELTNLGIDVLKALKE